MRPRIGLKAKCRCHSGKGYGECCWALHRGGLARTPTALMRSRYAAYSLGLAKYIMDTTAPESPHREDDKVAWGKSLKAFCKRTRFTGLTIERAEGGLETDGDGDDTAFVTFFAELKDGAKDASFRERSRFVRIAGRWLYLDAVDP